MTSTRKPSRECSEVSSLLAEFDDCPDGILTGFHILLGLGIQLSGHVFHNIVNGALTTKLTEASGQR